MLIVDVITVFQRPRAAATIEQPRKNRVRNVNLRPFNAIHSTSTFLTLWLSV
jgi:hypothetical protein